MRSSEAPTTERAGAGGAGRVARAVLALLLAGLGLLCLAYPFTAEGRERAPWLMAALGLLLLATSAVLWVNRVAGPAGGRRARIEQRSDGPVLVVGLRPATPLTMLLIGLSGTLLFTVAVLGVGLGEGGLLFAPLVLLFAVLVPDALLALRRRPRLEITSSTVTLHGWTVETSLAWDDVTAVAPGGAGGSLVLQGRPGAPSWSCRRHPRLLPLDRVPDAPRVVVPAGALDEPTRLEVVARRLVAAGPADRASYLAHDVLAFLSGGRTLP